MVLSEKTDLRKWIAEAIRSRAERARGLLSKQALEETQEGPL
jgi:hypothetical protein